MLTATMLDNGMVLLRDDVDGFEAAVSADDWAQLQAFPAESQRTELELLIIRRRRTGDPRTEQDARSMEASEQGQGERHQNEEEAR